MDADSYGYILAAVKRLQADVPHDWTADEDRVVRQMSDEQLLYGLFGVAA